MPSINNLLSALDERTIARRVGIPHDEARLRFARYVVARYAAFDVLFLVTGEWHYMADQPDLFRAVLY